MHAQRDHDRGREGSRDADPPDRRCQHASSRSPARSSFQPSTGSGSSRIPVVSSPTGRGSSWRKPSAATRRRRRRSCSVIGATANGNVPVPRVVTSGGVATPDEVRGRCERLADARPCPPTRTADPSTRYGRPRRAEGRSRGFREWARGTTYSRAWGGGGQFPCRPSMLGLSIGCRWGDPPTCFTSFLAFLQGCADSWACSDLARVG